MTDFEREQFRQLGSDTANKNQNTESRQGEKEEVAKREGRDVEKATGEISDEESAVKEKPRSRFGIQQQKPEKKKSNQSRI